METKKKMSSKKIKTLIQSEEEHLASLSTEPKTKGKSKSHKDKKIMTESCNNSTDANDTAVLQNVHSQSDAVQSENDKNQTNTIDSSDVNEAKSKKKMKQKKVRKHDGENQNISVKSSFTKFDALQKQNLIHNPQSESQSNCRLCCKPVYKMEEIKAEKSIFHKNCFRCVECNKQLKVDTYQSHEGKLYCIVHFKLIFAPKVSNDNEQDQPRKHELIIRENQPDELPPDVVRASSKPDLGLEELQQLNVRSRFHIFENGSSNIEPQLKSELQILRDSSVKRTSSIMMKLAKLKQNGCFVAEDTSMFENTDLTNSDTEEQDTDECFDIDDKDIDLVRSRKCTQRERPIGLGDAMSDIKSKFESGHMLTKEERREERKQEIQNIRSRLFLGKQARIKEMYQQAVAESEQGMVSAGKKTDLDIGCAARSLKERFEKGTVFDESSSKEHLDRSRNGIAEDADVFDSGISKKSRIIFMELDANVAAEKNHKTSDIKFKRDMSNTSKRLNSETELEDHHIDVVKYDEKPVDVEIQTSEISKKFKFFETYRPVECLKKEFRITPPRDGVVKLPTTDSDEEKSEYKDSNIDNVLEKSQTTSMMLNKFRQMENQSHKQHSATAVPRPLKCFTPPPDQGQRFYSDHDSDFDSEEESDEEEEEDDDTHVQDCGSKFYENDTALKEAQLAARAKILRAKFEKWEANEIQKEIESDCTLQGDSNETCIESTKALRERFENIGKFEKNLPVRNKQQVNRFV